MSALAPGLYRATVRGVADQIVIVDDCGLGHTMAPVAAAGSRHNVCDITDARPLIVLDMKGMNPTPILTGFLREVGYDWLASQISSQTKPARIPEPPRVGVGVMAMSDVADPGQVRSWTRFSTILLANWIDAEGRKRKWDDLIDPTLIRECLS